jgi:hypothetical protein
MIVVIITKKLPTGPGALDLREKGMRIAVSLHLLIILFFMVVLIYRVCGITKFINNGIRSIGKIQEVEIKSETLQFNYSYRIGGDIFFGNTSIYNKAEFQNYTEGTEIFILVDPNDYRHSLFTKIVD